MIKKIQGGLYLVVDPEPGLHTVSSKLRAALRGGVDAIQIWDNWSSKPTHEGFIPEVCKIAHEYDVPVLINNHWQWLKEFPLDGVHFDSIPGDLYQIRKQIDRNFFVGATCGNDWTQIDKAINHKVDYVSFCSMFPSATSNSCELINTNVVRRLCNTTNIPVYVSGGVTVDNLASLLPLGIKGVAIASGIMKADDVEQATTLFKQIMTNYSIEHN